MKADWLLFAAAALGFGALEKLFIRFVELSATYLVQSTLFLSTAWLLLRLLSRRDPSKPLNPVRIEKTWKLAALLPLITAFICVSTGWSTAIMNLPVAQIKHKRPQANYVMIDVSDAAPRADYERPENLEFESFGYSLANLNGRFLTRSDLEAMLQSSQEAHEPEITAITTSGAPKAVEKPIDVSRRTIPGERTPANDVTDLLATPSISPVATFGMVLFAWMACCVVRLIWKGIWLEIWLSRCTPIDSRISRMLFGSMPEACRIRLLRSQSAATEKLPKLSRQNTQAFACGLFRWTIVMPDGIEDRLSSDECRALLTHEVAHLVRRDPAWQWMGQLLCTCLAFQPLNFVARRQWLSASELLSDDWAIDHKVTATSLARCLTKIAEWQLDQKHNSRPITSFGLFAIGQGGSLTCRVEWLLRPRDTDKSDRLLVRSVTTAIAIAIGLLAGTHGPRLVLTASAGTNLPAVSRTSDTTQRVGNDVTLTLKSELSETNDELNRLRVQLVQLSEPEVDAVANDLLRRVQAIQKQFEE